MRLFQNPIFERDALRIVLLEPFLRVSPLANTLMWSTSPTWLLVLDVDKYRHWSLFSCRFPQWDCLPVSGFNGPEAEDEDQLSC
jgi:hypothetical protein